jgi:ParB/RepB/Spo0J family partition protein
MATKKLSELRRMMKEKGAAQEQAIKERPVSAALTVKAKETARFFGELLKYRETDSSIINYADLDLEDTTYQIRKVKADLTDLKEKIKTDGQTESISVRPSPTKPGKYQILTGFSRATVLTDLKKSVEAKVYKADMPHDMCVQIGINENIVKNDLQVIDMVGIVEELRSKFSITQTASIIGKKESAVKNYQRLNQNPIVLKALNEGMIGATAAFDYCKLDEKDQVKAIAAEAERVKSAKDTEKGPHKTVKRPVKPVFTIDKKKGKIFISSRTYNINQVEELINDFKGYLEQLRAIHK